MWGAMMTAMATPFDADLAVDQPAVERLCEHLLDTGTTAILVCGTTGESPTLTHDEKLALIQSVKRTVAGRVPVLAGTGSNDTRATVDLTREATELGVDGIMLVTPYYNKPAQEGLYQHFKAAAEATDRPVMIYNIEPRTARNIEPETIGRLAAEVPNIVALKEASGKITQFAAMARAVPPGFLLYSGNDTDTPAILCCGGVGVVSVASHLAGRRIAAMMAALLTGDLAGSAKEYLALTPLFEALFPAASPNPAPLKAGLELLGLCAARTRLPLTPAPEPVRAALRQALAGLGLL